MSKHSTPAPYQRIAIVADDSRKAQLALRELSAHHHFVDINRRRKPDVILVLGGDGFMLQVMHAYMDLKVPIYGMNCGTVGFLMNSYAPAHLAERLAEARPATLYPLGMYARSVRGKEVHQLAFNEVSLLRQTRQAARIRVTVDHVVRIQDMVCDGVLVATAAGSTAYNSSAGGPVIPLGANMIALTPISPFRPRRWSGAMLPHTSTVNFEILDPHKRPVSAVADFTEVRDITSVAVSEQRKVGVTILFDPEHNLEERMIKEQFMG